MIMFAAPIGRRGLYHHIYQSAAHVRMCGADPVEVDVVEDPNGQYVGWQPTGKQSFTMVYPSIVLFNLCFPYGYENEEKYGKGRMVKLTIVGR